MEDSLLINLRKTKKATTEDFKFIKKGGHTLCISRVGQCAGIWGRELSEQNTLYIKCSDEVKGVLLSLDLSIGSPANMINVSQQEIIEAYEQFTD